MGEYPEILKDQMYRDGFSEGYNAGFDAGVKHVEPVGSLKVYTPRQSIDDTHVTEIRTRRRLLPGRYVIVREVDDE